jgi:hypothetical protein
MLKAAAQLNAHKCHAYASQVHISHEDVHIIMPGTPAASMTAQCSPIQATHASIVNANAYDHSSIDHAGLHTLTQATIKTVHVQSSHAPTNNLFSIYFSFMTSQNKYQTNSFPARIIAFLEKLTT